jgi:hypothetical protein
MGQGSLLQTSCLRILLIAAAIQGVTPDSKDLASIHALKLICPVLAGSDQATDVDEFPDDVCEPLLRRPDAGKWCFKRPSSQSVAGITPRDAQSATMSAARQRLLCRMGSLIPPGQELRRPTPLIC